MDISKVTAQCFYCDLALDDKDALVIITHGRAIVSCGACYADVVRGGE